MGKQGVMYGWGEGDPCVGEQKNAAALANSQGFGPWKGVGCVPCTDEPRLYCVSQIWLHQKSLNGSIPEEFRDMKELAWLFLSANNMTGPLPTSIWKTFPKLSMLDLSYNTITGDLPLGAMSGNSRLVRILANDNQFDSISYSGGGFQSLLELNFMYNRNMSGTFPLALGEAPKLRNMYVHDTNLTHLVPQGAWPYVRHLVISGNGKLCGRLPQVCKYEDETWCDLRQDLGECPTLENFVAAPEDDDGDVEELERLDDSEISATSQVHV